MKRSEPGPEIFALSRETGLRRQRPCPAQIWSLEIVGQGYGWGTAMDTFLFGYRLPSHRRPLAGLRYIAMGGVAMAMRRPCVALLDALLKLLRYGQKIVDAVLFLPLQTPISDDGMRGAGHAVGGERRSRARDSR